MISDKQNEFFYQFKKRRALKSINIIILISFFISRFKFSVYLK